MTDLNFLSVGKLFPPIEEAKRIGAYTEYDLLFDGNSHAVEAKHFRETLKNLNTLAMKMGWTDSYLSIEMNYFRFISKKTMDFVCGEYPDITAGDKKNELIDEIRRETVFDKKHNDAWLSVSRYGLCPLRIYRDGAHDTFTLVNPKNYYKIASTFSVYSLYWFGLRFNKSSKIFFLVSSVKRTVLMSNLFLLQHCNLFYSFVND